MREPVDGRAPQPAETLQVGPSRPPLSERVPDRWRLPLVVGVSLLLGAVAGAGAVLWSQADPPERAPFRGDEHAVELVLLEVAPGRPGTGSTSAPTLHLGAGLLLSGVVTSTVLSIDPPGDWLEVRAPALPVTVSPSGRFRSLDLELVIGDCEPATGWTPRDRSFTLTWRDEHARLHLDRAGDFDKTLGRALARHVDAACAGPSGTPTGPSGR